MLEVCQSSTLRTGRGPTGAKLALKPVHVWGIRIRLQVASRLRDLALFDLALDSKLRGCDLVALRISALMSASGVKSRVMILQRKTGRPVQFEVTEQTRRSLAAWIDAKCLPADDWLFPSRSKRGAHLSTRQYARLVAHQRATLRQHLEHVPVGPLHRVEDAVNEYRRDLLVEEVAHRVDEDHARTPPS